MRKLIALALIAISFASGAAQAGVVNCDARGNRQRNGAVVGDNVSHKAGAAAGSAIGCNQQKQMAGDKARATHTGNAIATAATTIRARPSTRSARVGTLRKGEHAQVIRWEGNWAVIGYKGGARATGYVMAGNLRRAR
jgi:hypothetical protein